MFKLESYITPVILSYVEKYVKNFKPEQSQVSLWGGDASFQNLDLRLEVLEEQLNLPFTFVSGHIHELLIHVPWVKITSEPIVVTINTIECILKLKEENQCDNVNKSSPQKEIAVSEEEAPPGYISSIVNKVINNITINCNNLILKYVEEDIVLSMNVRFLSMQSVNKKWEPAFTDMSSYEVRLQKIITIQDLTLCLDKMDTSGKIEIYQDPVLYRCSLTIRLIMSYHSQMAKRASITRFDVHCQKMEFSITEQQIPMILRLLALVTTLQSRQFPVAKEKSSMPEEENDNIANDLAQVTKAAGEAGWGMWAWNTVSSIIPMDWENNWSDELLDYSGHIVHFGFFIDDATITFKAVESVKEQLFYKSRKIKYKPFLSIHFSEAVMDGVLQGISMTNVYMGVGTIQLYPREACSCEFPEVSDGVQPPLYLTAGLKKDEYLKNTLFDDEAVENQGKKREYKKDVSHYLSKNSVSELLERCPAVSLDYVHYAEIPEDVTPQQLAELSSGFEYSNFREERHIRYTFGDITLRVCSGLLHRIDTIRQAAEKYDYNPYIVPKTLPKFDELPPVTVEEYEALRENIPILTTYLYVKKVAVQLQLADHYSAGLPRQRNLVKQQQQHDETLSPCLSEEPHVSLEAGTIEASLEEPIYPFRLIACASKQTEIPAEMLTRCYRKLKFRLNGVGSQVFLKSERRRTPLVLPCNVEGNLRTILYPDYWKEAHRIHGSHELSVDSITITGTKRKIAVAAAIVSSLLCARDDDDLGRLVSCSSICNDSRDEKSPIYLELCLDNIQLKGVASLCTRSYTADLASMKIFAHSETEQAFILSGPEHEEAHSNRETRPLVSAIVQFSNDLVDNPQHPTILSFRMAPMKACLDPLLLKWLDYQVNKGKCAYSAPQNVGGRPEQNLTQAGTESIVSDPSVTRKRSSFVHESVHSSSDKDKRKIDEAVVADNKSAKKSTTKTYDSDAVLTQSESLQQKQQQRLHHQQEQLEQGASSPDSSYGLWARLTQLSPWWSTLILDARVDHTIVYVPTRTMSGIDLEGIEEAKDAALKSDENLRILVVKLPVIGITSSNTNAEPSNYLSKYAHELPIRLPKNIWAAKTHSFPWTLEISDLEMFTLKGSARQNFVKKIRFKATLDLVTKSTESTTAINESAATLSLCLYIDTSPIIVSLNEEQVSFLHALTNDIASVTIAAGPASQTHSSSIGEARDSKDLPAALRRSSSSPTQQQYLEDATTTSTMSAVKKENTAQADASHVSACIQWTIAKISVKLYVLADDDTYANSKLALELEDIITSIDVQPVYFKLKHKITTATIFHYVRSSQSQQWDLGEYAGILMSGREGQMEKNEDSGFLCLTLTVAKSGNVHTRWGARKSYKLPRKDSRMEVLQPSDTYITEALVKIQPIDLTVAPSVLGKYVGIARPLLLSDDAASRESRASDDDAKIMPPFIGIAKLRSESLPLVYFDLKGLRIMLPTTMDDPDNDSTHDLLMLQVDGVRITPHAENPICRVPLRPDIYQLAGQANILNVPGSAVEDRQYQINVDGISAFTTTWKGYQRSVMKRVSQSYLYTMNENPAVEWNKLGNGSSLEPHLPTLPIVTRFDFCFIVAPVIIFKPDTIVCASAAELNCLTDLELMFNPGQIKLVAWLLNQLQGLVPSGGKSDRSDIFETPRSQLRNQPSFTSSLKGSHLIKQTIPEFELDVAKDSGVDFDSCSLTSSYIGKTCARSNELTPFECLMNCGKVTIVFYDVVREPVSPRLSTRTENEKGDEANNTLKSPLVYAVIDQPNLYFYQQQSDQRIQFSCFDVSLLLGNETGKRSTSIPSASDFTTFILETKSGEAHLDTGIPPSFLVVKWDACKNSQMSINMGRPTKVHFSLARLDKLLRIRDQLIDCLDDGRAHTVVGADRCNVYNNSTSSSPDSGSSAAQQQQQQQVSSSNKYRVPDTNLSTKQLVFSLETSDGTSELLLSLASFSASASNSSRPERIFGSFSWDSLVVSIRDHLSRADASAQKATTMLLNPCSCSVSVCLLWEPWQQKAEPPQIQVQAECDCLHLDLGPRHILACQSGLGDLTKILSRTTEANSTSNELDRSHHHRQQQQRRPTKHEQHYQDDLKSGAFQFVDGTTDELPFPYQVVFHSQPQRAMAWRYPHPRTLTRIHVSPVPMEEASSSETGDDDDDDDGPGQRLGCAIEYWSESQTTYQRYVDFYLSEQESYRLDLPEHAPLQAVACVWRIVLLNGASRSSRRRLSSKALLACLRIDSYFNPRIVPSLQAAVSLGCVQLRLFNQLEDEEDEEQQQKQKRDLPAPLARYELAGQVPANQCFAVLELSRAQLALSRWSSTEVALVRANAALGLRLLDYGLLLSQEVVEPAEWQLRLSRGPSPDLALDLSLACEPFDVRLSPASFHALSLAAQLWAARLLSASPAAAAATAPTTTTTLRPLTTRYVVANDTNVPLRFGQDATNDSIMLESGQCHFYSWRHATNQALKVGMEDANGWHWSKPFSIKEDACFDLELSGSVEQPSVVLSCRVSALSASQKLVTFVAQFVVSNQLQDGFEMRLIKYDALGKSRASLYPESFFLAPRSRPASIVLADPTNVAMRLRFSSVPNLAWTGDIPLQPNARWGQPWLVKVPLQERGQFISIWVRMITETIDGVVKILAVTSPLYMIRSYLPVPAKVQIETPSLGVSLQTVINGRGERQQMYCPGTFEHAHQLTFQIESGVSASDPFVPLSYASVDQRKFFKRPDKESIRDILEALEAVDKDEEAAWPFFQQSDGDGDELFQWVAGDQPQTHVQVRYEDAGLVSSTLLLELQPWCFVLNSLGCEVSIVAQQQQQQQVELCRVPHYGIVAPPKLEGSFYLGVRQADTFFMSAALQFDRPEWSQSFYKPRVQGSIPLEGNLKVCVDLSSSLTQISINSSLHKDMRVLRIGSNYVIGNMTGHDFWAAALAVPASARNLQLHDHAPTDKSIKISAATERRYAVPIVQWHKISDATDGPFVFYVALRLSENKWSCPIRVDQGLARRCIALPRGRESLPLVVTTQEDKGTVYVTIHEDKQPQLLIDNVCPYGIVVGQSDQERDNVIPDAEHFDWKCCIESKSSCYYSMPSIGSNLPDLPISSEATSVSMLVAGLVDDRSSSSYTSVSDGSIQWSKSVELSDKLSDHLLRLPARGDVKISTRAQCYTIRVRFSPVSQYEISAQDIRSKIERKSNLQQQQQRASSPDPSQHENNNASWLAAADLDNRVNSQCSSASNATTYVSAQDDDAEAAAARPTSRSGNNNDDEHDDDDDDYNTRNTSSSSSHASATLHFRGISFVLMKDVNEQGQRIEVLSLSTTDTILQLERDSRGESQVSLHVGDLQLDNQMFESGGYDFPVVLVSQRPLVRKDTNANATATPPVFLSTSPKKNLEDIVDNCLLGVQLSLQEGVYKEIAVKLAPVSAYVEGAFVTLLMDFVTATLPACLSSTSSGQQQQQQQVNARSSEKNSSHSIAVPLPDHVLVDARILSQPLRLQSFLIEPVSILLSVHTSVHLYVAFDHSPLFFEAFDKRNLVTTPYRLGNALAMHYLSGAIFGVGWVVGSLEILGSLGGLAQALGSGLKDFVSLPFQGLLQGPWGFVVGVTHGSASLVKHVTAGTVNSVTKLASSVARNLDRLTLDEEHLQRQEEFRRTRPQGVAQGLYQGLTGLGMSLLAAVAGLAHHPLQQVWSGEASTRGLVSGVGRGLVGVVTKPLSGAAELVALTGQGLLQGTGWSSLPEPRQRAVVQYPTERAAESSSCLRYAWRLMPLLQANQDNILYVCQAERVLQQQQQVSSDKHPVSLVLTRQMLLIVSLAEDSLEKVLPIKDLLMSSSEHEPTQLRLYYSTAATVAAANAAAAAAAAAAATRQQLEQSNHSRPGSPLETSAPIHMDREIRARVAEFLRTSSAGITSVSSNSDTASENCEASTLPDPDNCYTFHLSADSRAYFIALLSLLRRQCRGHGFAVV
ncbi:vacuolar protein sorting-associated protein 13B isoform X2 [Trichogramma pretiosum]|uniref:vacuolar protein sorting-associated protein 13B isoform X2 n=1 Tax=Trichogramma pretiosum TaxID=7493 RepID=UPI000C719515|nr:vacuolar protein sorting-associated protein 13B isoform X2 [Trichogramma pretiosum]